MPRQVDNPNSKILLQAAATSSSFRKLYRTLTFPFLCLSTCVIVATTAEKLDGTSRGVDADPLVFPHPSLPTVTQLPGFTHSLPYSCFPLPLEYS